MRCEKWPRLLYLGLYRPLNLWQRSDLTSEIVGRMGRFHRSVLEQQRIISVAVAGHGYLSLFLEPVSMTDETEIWMAAIWLISQRLRVEVVTEGQHKDRRRYEHHMMWCGNGISAAELAEFSSRLRSWIFNDAYQTGLQVGAPQRSAP